MSTPDISSVFDGWIKFDDPTNVKKFKCRTKFLCVKHMLGLLHEKKELCLTKAQQRLDDLKAKLGNHIESHVGLTFTPQERDDIVCYMRLKRLEIIGKSDPDTLEKVQSDLPVELDSNFDKHLTYIRGLLDVLSDQVSQYLQESSNQQRELYFETVRELCLACITAEADRLEFIVNEAMDKWELSCIHKISQDLPVPFDV